MTTAIPADPNKSLRSWDPSEVLLLEPAHLPSKGGHFCFAFTLLGINKPALTLCQSATILVLRVLANSLLILLNSFTNLWHQKFHDTGHSERFEFEINNE
jgi:hypothetical protein